MKQPANYDRDQLRQLGGRLQPPRKTYKGEQLPLPFPPRARR